MYLFICCWTFGLFPQVFNPLLKLMKARFIDKFKESPGREEYWRSSGFAAFEYLNYLMEVIITIKFWHFTVTILNMGGYHFKLFTFLFSKLEIISILIYLAMTHDRCSYVLIHLYGRGHFRRLTTIPNTLARPLEKEKTV